MNTVFTTIFYKLIPLYTLIFLGYLGGKRLRVEKETLAALLLYVLAPAVVFFGVMTVRLDVSRLLLPLLFFPICSFICFLSLKIAGKLWPAPTKNILAFSAGSGNTGYFGLPVTLFLFGEGAVGLAVLIAFGFIFYENSVGFFISARGHHTAKEAFHRVLRLPTIYAFILALILNLSGIELNRTFTDLAVSFRGAYTVLGMMMIGLGVSSIKNLKVDFKFIGFTFLAKFLVWPAVAFILIFLNESYYHFFDVLTAKVIVLMSIVPLPANSVAVAINLRAEPEKMAMAVLASTLFALFYIPLMVGLFISV